MSDENEGTGPAPTRRELIGGAAAAAAAAGLAGSGPDGMATAAARRRRLTRGDFQGKNVLIFITDQEQALQHFPKRWAQRNLPGQRRLLKHGVNFKRAYTNACMCTPARSTLVTGFFPAQHGCNFTLEQDMPADLYPQVELSRDFANIATVMKAAGYEAIYKGKWHLSKPIGQEFSPADLAVYGFDRWNPPDAGANQDVSEAGGGDVDNDGRYMYSVGEPQAGTEGVLQYISDVASQQQPFCLIVSLVNPHDVLLWPKTWDEAGYTRDWLTGEVDLPPTVDEDLATKPRVQEQFLRVFNLTGELPTDRKKRRYINFYGNLIKSSDAYLAQILDALQDQGLRRDTVIIRTSDHGEMGLSHGGLRQKNFNMYEEATRVPLIVSNPRLYPEGADCDHLVSHVDFLPTLASLFGAPESARADWQGVDYSASILNPEKAKAPQDYVLFTYEDYQSGQKTPPYPSPPNHLVGLREKRWKIVRYYDIEGVEPDQWEMYDLKAEPLEERNLADKPSRMTASEKKQFKRLKKKLANASDTRLQPLPNTPSPQTPPSNRGTIPIRD
jgi:arylsulfatase A-like enzyme